jgi:hypothetical protein
MVARQRFGKNSLIIARQQLCKNVTVATNTHSKIEELFDSSFSMRSVSYKGKQAMSSSNPQGPTIVGTGNGTPEDPELPSA